MTAPAVAVRERPILMSGPMVRAILDGRKTQTRRVVLPQPPSAEAVRAKSGSGYDMHRSARAHRWSIAGPVWAVRDLMGREPEWTCPYGQPGDRLWVREALERGNLFDGDVERTDAVYYRADGALTFPDAAWVWQRDTLPSQFCPRGLSRIRLELTDVRVERLQDISEADAKAEGARRFDDIPDPHPFGQGARWSMGNPASTDECLGTPRFAFASTWNALNAKRGYGWDANPWVWVLTFRRVA